MRFFVVATRSPDQPAEAFQPHLAAESRRATEMYRDGLIREIYSRADGKGAVLVFEAASEAEVAAGMKSLPMVENGLLGFEIHGVGPYRGFLASLG